MAKRKNQKQSKRSYPNRGDAHLRREGRRGSAATWDATVLRATAGRDPIGRSVRNHLVRDAQSSSPPTTPWPSDATAGRVGVFMTRQSPPPAGAGTS